MCLARRVFSGWLLSYGVMPGLTALSGSVGRCVMMMQRASLAESRRTAVTAVAADGCEGRASRSGERCKRDPRCGSTAFPFDAGQRAVATVPYSPARKARTVGPRPCPFDLSAGLCGGPALTSAGPPSIDGLTLASRGREPFRPCPRARARTVAGDQPFLRWAGVAVSWPYRPRGRDHALMI